MDSESNLKAALEALTGGQPLAAAGVAPAPEEITLDQIGTLLPAYLEIQKALAADDLSKASAAAAKVKDIKLPSLEAIAATSDVAQARISFHALSRSIIPALEKAGAPAGQLLYRLYCPMVQDYKGGEWLQTDKDVRNPYFGASMLECGEVKSQIQAKEKMPMPDPHAGHVR